MIVGNNFQLLFVLKKNCLPLYHFVTNMVLINNTYRPSSGFTVLG